MMSTLIIVSIVLLLVYLIHRVMSFFDKRAKEKLELLREQEAQKAFEEAMKLKKEKKPEPEPLYQMKTHNIRYRLYNHNRDLQHLSCLYKLVVHNLYWINEPFHSMFYKILLIFDKNNFMIFDPSSKVITMNVRYKDNQIKTSKSYQVFSTRDIIKVLIPNIIGDITRFNKKDAQNILIAIFIYALKKSVHYLSKDVSIEAVNVLLDEYEYSDSLKYINSLIEEKNSQLVFIIDAFKEAFRTTLTLPYNDVEVPQLLQLPQQLPSKLLQEI